MKRVLELSERHAPSPGEAEIAEPPRPKGRRNPARGALVALILILCAYDCLAQTSYLGIKPGSSTRADVVRILGQPVKQINETMVEHSSQSGTGAIYVEYRAGSELVGRIEVYLLDNVSRDALIQGLKLTDQPEAKKNNSKGRLIEYFGSPRYLSLTYAGGDISAGVKSVGYYGEEMYDLALGKPPVSKNAGNIARNSEPAPGGQGYREVVERARGSLQALDYNGAMRFAQQAVPIEPGKAEAYEIIGIAQLYGMRDIGAAATAMRAAVDRGGSAAFGITHDHDGFFQSYCQGSLYVNKYGVSYRGNDGSHSFNVNYNDVKEAKLNNLVGSNFHSFHIKVNENGKTKTYNFAPGTLNAAETNLILTLMRNP